MCNPHMGDFVGIDHLPSTIYETRGVNISCLLLLSITELDMRSQDIAVSNIVVDDVDLVEEQERRNLQ